MSRKTRKLIWSAPLVAVLAVAGALAMFAAQGTGSVFAHQLPAAPMNLTVEPAEGDAGRTTLVLNWEAAANASGYRIDKADDGQGGVWENLVENTGDTMTTYSDATLTAEDTRWYRVFALNSHGSDHGVGPVSNAVSGTTKDKVNPGSVMNLRAMYNSKNPYNHIDLTWDPPADNGGEMIIGYEIQNHVGGNWVAIGGTTEDQATIIDEAKTSYTDKSTAEVGGETVPQLDPGDSRLYRVRAVNGTADITTGDDIAVNPAGDSSKEWVTVTGMTKAASAPGPVTGLTAVNADGDTINLYWYDPEETGGLDIEAYLIQARREGKKFPALPKDDDLQITDAPATTNLGGADNPDNINRYLAKPDAGAVLQASFDTTAIDPDGTGPKPAAQVRWYFRVYALTFDDGTEEEAADTDDDVIRRSQSPSNVASDTAAVREIDHDDDGGTTPAVDPLDEPVITPTGTTSAATDGALKQKINLVLALNPDIVTNNNLAGSPDVVQIAYRIDYSADGGVTWKLLERDTRFTGFSATKPYVDDNGLSFDERRHYRVFAIGRHPYSDVGPASALAFGWTLTSGPPKKPTGVMASAPSLTSIMASWTAPENNGGQDIVKYYYQYVTDDDDGVAEAADFDTSVNTGATVVDGTTDDAMTMHTFTELTLAMETDYVFRVAAVNKDTATPPADRPANATAVAAADWSDPVLFSTSEAAKPNAVEGLTSELATDASDDTNLGVNLLWNKPSDKIAITGYEVEVQDEDGDWVSPLGGGDVPAHLTRFTDSEEYTAADMAAGVVRKYQVRAKNGVGEGPWTMVYYPREPAADHRHIMVPGKPMASAMADSDTQITVSWTDPADNGGAAITGYIIERRYMGDMMGDIPSDGYNDAVDGASFAFSDHMEWWETLNCKGMLRVFGSDEDPAGSGPDKMMYCAHYAMSGPTADMTFANPIAAGSDLDMKIEALFDKRYIMDYRTDATATMHADMGLEPDTKYTYRVSAVNSAGRSMWSDPAMAETQSGMPTAPTNVMARHVGSTVTITWEADMNADQFALVLVTRKDDGSWDTVNAVTDVGVSGSPATVPMRHRPAGTYVVLVAAGTDDGVWTGWTAGTLEYAP